MSAADDSKPDSRRCIIAAAAKLFARLGIDKCSTREIAKASDSNISLISYYFGGKEGLYKEVMRNHAMGITAGVQGMLKLEEISVMSKDLFLKEMTLMIDLLIRIRVANPEMAQIFAREKLIGMPYAKDVHDEIFYPLMTRFFTLFRRAQDDQVVRSDVNAALFFVTLSEGIWGFFELFACETKINKDFKNLATDHVELRNQIIKIYLMGAML